MFHPGFFGLGPSGPGWRIRAQYLSNTEPCPFRHCDARGEHIIQAAEEGNVRAVRHFLRVDPESLEEDARDTSLGRSLGTDVGSYEADPRLP